MRTIPLTQNKFALIDDEDFQLINQHKWCVAKYGNNYCAMRGYKNKQTNKNTTLYMHRLILKINDSSIKIDHINGNSLDNRKNNLRTCIQQQNTFKRKKQKNTTSKYKGVVWIGERSKWRVRIQVSRKMKHLGYFNNEIEAAKIYDIAAKEYFGEFAKLNFNN